MRMSTTLSALAVLTLPALGHGLEIEPTERASGEISVLGAPLSHVEAGLGLGNFTGDAADDLGAGSAWNARIGIDASQPVDLELAYVGGVNAVTADGLDQFRVYSNGVQAALRLEPYTIEDVVTPFLSGGLGLTRMSVAKDTELAASFQSDTAAAVPLAIGADVTLGENVTLGARAQWDLLFDEEFAVQAVDGHTDHVGILINLGATGF